MAGQATQESILKSQQKCIAIFALLCCFAVLLALMFSAVDVWVEEEDGITEENCNKNCRIVLVENIPEGFSFSSNATTHLPLTVALNGLLDLAKWSVEIVSSQWDLTSLEQQTDYFSANESSPDLFCAKDRTRDIDAIQRVILEAKKFIYVSVTNYLPLVWKTSNGQQLTRYWSIIDEALREALVLRRVRVYLLISLWKKTHPLTYNFVTSLKSLCLGLENCSLDVKFFSGPEENYRSNRKKREVNNNKYIVTDNSLYIGNLDWVGNEFTFNAGNGLVIKSAEGKLEGRPTILDQVKAAFERDWFSHDAKRLQDLILSGRTAGNPGLHPVKSEIRSKDRKVMRSMSL
uniref:PLD-like domain-containing protein n=1 Tax=Denticeps clupeoides TaxID=299321 RepID=A0AAY4EV63_9TELE